MFQPKNLTLMKSFQKIATSMCYILVAVLLQTFTLSCKREKEAPIFEVDPNFGEYVSAYTSGLIAANSPITIKLSQPAADFTSEGNEVGTKLFDFSPSIKGKTYWVNNQEVVFKPQSPLKSGERYTASFKVNALFDIRESRLKVFNFTFRVIPQTLSVDFCGLTVASLESPNTYNLEGTIFVADYTTDEKLAECIKAKHNGRELPIKITSQTSTNTFNVIIEGIERESKNSSVTVSWSSKPIGGNSGDSQTFDVPQLSKFIVCSSTVTQAPNQSVTLTFSDLLNPQQDYNGMVEIEGCNDLRFEVDRNKLKIYPTMRIESTHAIRVDQGITNILGDKLDKEFTSTYVFEDIKPSVRKVSNGVILPTSEGLIFPFEAVNLKSVLVEVIKIFENNIPYYLQSNRMGENDELNRVGYPVLKKVVDLNQVGVVVPNKWERYVLDLKSLLTADPGAIYRIKISFNKHQLLSPCDGIEAKPTDETINISDFTEPGYYSDYDYTYDEEYDWNQRDNPCNSAYYSDERKIKQCILSSDIGIIAKLGNNAEMVVAVNNIPTAKPIADADVRVSDYQNQTIAEGTTNADGLITLKLPRQPFLVTAKHSKQKGYLRVDNATSNSLSSFDVSGAEIQNGIKGYIYGERGVWRPGDTLHLCFMVEDKEKTIPTGHPIVFELTDSRGLMVKKMVKSHNDVGIYHFPVATDLQATTGNWHATVKLGGATFSKTVMVEAIKPNRLKVNLKLKDDKIQPSGNVEANLNVKWLHGTSGSNLKAAYEITVSKAKTELPNHANFTFDDPSINFTTATNTLWEGTTNQNGDAKVFGTISRTSEMPSAIKVQFKGRVFEPGGDFSIDLFSKIYNPYNKFVGILLPKPEAGKNWLETGADHQITLATVDANGNPVSCSNLVVELFKISWRWWWEQPDNGEASYVSHDYRNLVMRSTASTKDGRGTASIRIDYPNWGRYFLKVTNRSNGNSCGTYVYFDWPYGMAKTQGDRPDGANILSLAADKLEYKVDEDIKLTFPGTSNARALISIENGSRVVSSYWVDAGNATNVAAIRVLPTMAPNIYVHVTLLQPHGDKDNDLPIRMFGIIPLKISNPKTLLKPTITMASEFKAENMTSILIRESSGQKMNFTLAIVDEGLLDINRFKTPDPHSTFYAREAIGVKTWDLYNDVIGAYGGKIERLLSIGGDESLELDESGQVLRFKPVVRFFGPFTVEGGRSKKIDFMMPNYVGSVRVMVVAANNGAYGFAEKTCPVRNDLMVMTTLPRILGPNEEVSLPINVFISNPEISKAKVKVQTSDNIEIMGDNEVSIEPNGETEKMVHFKFKVGTKCGPAKIRVTAEGKNAHSKQELDVEIRNPNTKITQSISTIVPADSNLQVNFSTFGINGSNSVQLEASIMPPLNLQKRLGELIAYPHGCLEQTVSAAFPQVYLKTLVELNEEQNRNTNSFVKEAITKIGRLQNANGGFRYWPSSTTTDEWSTTYAGHFLVEARSNGYDVPQNIIENWISYQRQAARQFSPKQDGVYRHKLIQAYRLYTLALAKKPEVGAMNKLKEQELDIASKMRLAQAYVLIGQKATAKSLVDNNPLVTTDYRELGYTFGSQNRDRAIILETLLMLGQQNTAFPIAVELSNKIASNSWLSTHETAVMLNALSKLAIGDGKRSNLALKYRINGTKGEIRSDMPIGQTPLSAVKVKNLIELTNEGNKPIFTNIAISGIPELGTEEAFNNNLNLSVKYELGDGTNINPARISQDVDFICSITVYNPGIRGELRELALTQIFPSGWEIQNARFEGSQQETSGFEYQDIRDDRVLTYFSLLPNQSKTFRVKLTATYAGRFYMPGAYCEAMYDNTVSAAQMGGWVVVE